MNPPAKSDIYYVNVMRKIIIFVFFPNISDSRVVILISHIVYVELAEICRPLPFLSGVYLRKERGAAIYFIKLINSPFSGNRPVSFFE